MRRRRIEATALACGLLLVAGCGHVAANYPASRAEAPLRTIDPAAYPAATIAGVTIRVGPIWDPTRLLAAKRETDDQMRAAMGDAAFESMASRVTASRACRPSLEEVGDRTIFRGAIELRTDRAVVIDRGAVILTLADGGDTVRVRDEGILFFRHDTSPVECLFTGDGPVRYERAWNGLPPGAENRCNVLASRGGKVVAVALDSLRLRVLGQ